MMSRFDWLPFLCIYLATFLVAPACAGLGQSPLPYAGAYGQEPVEVAVQFLKDRLTTEEGRIDYKMLTIVQRSKPQEMSDQVSITVVQNGLLDDSIQGIRWRLQLRLNSERRWQIDTVKEDFSCHRSRQGWSRKLCV